MARNILKDLAGQVGPDHIYSRPADLAAYSYDSFGASGDRHLPLAVVFPDSVEAVSGVVQVCAYHRVPLVPRGAGTGYSGGAVGDGAVILSLVELNSILGISTDSKRLHAQAGVITANIQQAADDRGLYYPPDPGSVTTSTIGGNVACNASGPHSLRYGSTADFVTGLTAVLADGAVVHLGEGGDGGADLMGLLSGSEGTLAVITDVRLRLIDKPAARATLAAVFPSMEKAADSMAAIAKVGVVPSALECMDAAAIEAVRLSGAAHVPHDAGAFVIAEVEGDERVVTVEVDKVREALTKAGAISVDHAVDGAGAKELWAARKAISAAVATVMIGKVNEDVVVPRPRIAELVTQTRAIGEKHNVPTVTFGHLGEGNLHVTFLIDPRREGERQRADAAIADLFEAVLSMGGSLTGEHGIGTTKLPWVEKQLGSDTVALMRRIKQTLDPRGVMNPGKKVPVEV